MASSEQLSSGGGYLSNNGVNLVATFFGALVGAALWTVV